MRELIVRADDLGLSEAVNYGIYSSVSNGIVTAVGIMVNMIEVFNGYQLIKDYQKLSLGLHTNIVVGKPISPLNMIPSLIDRNGNFISSKIYRKQTEDSVIYEEALIEVQAQVDKFIEIVGRKPDYIDNHAVVSKHFDQAIRNIALKNDIIYVPFLKNEIHGKECFCCPFPWNASYEDYDPYPFFLDNQGQILDHVLSLAVFHPGFIDDELLHISSLNLSRSKDVKVLTDSKIKQWIENNKIQLVNFKVFL